MRTFRQQLTLAAFLNGTIVVASTISLAFSVVSLVTTSSSSVMIGTAVFTVVNTGILLYTVRYTMPAYRRTAPLADLSQQLRNLAAALPPGGTIKWVDPDKGKGVMVFAGTHFDYFTLIDADDARTHLQGGDRTPQGYMLPPGSGFRIARRAASVWNNTTEAFVFSQPGGAVHFLPRPRVTLLGRLRAWEFERRTGLPIPTEDELREVLDVTRTGRAF